MKPEISVVIGFRDWGLRRLELATTSIQRSFGEIPGEVIISDYGSFDRTATEEMAARVGAKYVYTETDGPWSRSRALNAGFMVAEGEFLVSTDADMIFSPQAFETIGRMAQAEATSAFFLQCRDLQPGMDDDWVASNSEAWDEMEASSRLRPRWGMGGMMAIHRSGFEIIRGFDERLHTYGGEDLDFAQRARRAGFRTHWIEHPKVRMYHMWHPATSKAVERSEEGRKAVEYNRSVVYHDKTFVRNYLAWTYRPSNIAPLVTIAISTRDRSDMIGETILSVLAQSVQDFEVVVVDDGGTDNTREVVESFNDARIRYFWQEPAGISAARNRALDESRGIYTAVIDDDDLMHPSRLEWHFSDLKEGFDGNAGSFMNFNDETGETELHVSMIPTRATAVEKGAAPGHGTWLIRTDVMRRFRYDETITSGVDNNIMLRMLRAGVNLGHTGKPVTLRRLHPRQVTVTDSDRQLGAAASSLDFFRWNIGGYYEKKLLEEKSEKGAYPKGFSRDEMAEIVAPYLPDHLVKRNISFSIPLNEKVDHWDGDASFFRFEVDGYGEVETATVHNASYVDLVRARQTGIPFNVEVSPESEQEDAAAPQWIQSVLGLVEFDAALSSRYVAFVPGRPNELTDALGVSLQLFSGTSEWSLIGCEEDQIRELSSAYPGSIIAEARGKES